jgi:hypothetical protein
VQFRVLLNAMAANAFQPPVLVPASHFEIVSSKLPSSWEIQTGDTWMEVAPGSWLQDGFWEAIFEMTDDSEWARPEYDRHVAIMLNEDREARDAGE